MRGEGKDEKKEEKGFWSDRLDSCILALLSSKKQDQFTSAVYFKSLATFLFFWGGVCVGVGGVSIKLLLFSELSPVLSSLFQLCSDLSSTCLTCPCTHARTHARTHAAYPLFFFQALFD